MTGSGQRPVTPDDEIRFFEVIERSTGLRAMEVVFVSASRALDWLEAQKDSTQGRKYRVQEVRVQL